jgi:hypothetical protein
LEDKRQEEFEKPPPPKYIAFDGGAHKISSAEGVGMAVNKETGMPVVDESKETTKIRFRFHNGERAEVIFNTDMTVGDIHMYVMQAAPIDGSYQLVFGRPPVAVEGDGTIKAKGLIGELL